jgi:hypothetical protein
MKKILLFGFLIFLVSCEIFTIGSSTKKVKIVEINQKSPMGAVYLFKTELDSSNIPAATQILASPEGKPYLAIEKFELYDDVARIGRMIKGKPITSMKADSLSPAGYKVSVEFDYIKKMYFTTKKIDELWFITNYSD